MAATVREHPVRAVVIDDTRDIRELLSIVLTRRGMHVVGEAGDGREGVDVVRSERPDVVLLDLAMPVMDGIEALPLIRALVPDARIIVLSAFSGAPTFWSTSHDRSFAPPCRAPLSVPTAETIAEWRSESVEAVTRAAKVEAFSSCSA